MKRLFVKNINFGFCSEIIIPTSIEEEKEIDYAAKKMDVKISDIVEISEDDFKNEIDKKDKKRQSDLSKKLKDRDLLRNKASEKLIKVVNLTDLEFKALFGFDLK